MIYLRPGLIRRADDPHRDQQHDHEHQSVPSDLTLRVKALEADGVIAGYRALTGRATMLPDWRICRVTGEALLRLGATSR